MFLRLQLLLLFLFTASFSCMAQIDVEDVLQLKNTARFEGGQDEYSKLFAKNLRYPIDAQRNNKIGTVIGVIKIARNGDIVETGSLNTSDKLFKDEFKRLAQLSKGKWTATNDTAEFFYAVIPLQFKFQGSNYTLEETHKPAYFQETIISTAVGRPTGWEGVYSELEREYVEKVNTGIEKGTYTESIKALLELINLQPYHLNFYEPLIMLYRETGQLKQEAYYNALLNQLTTQAAQ